MSDPMSMAVAGLGSIKAALEITKTISDARNTSNLLSVKLELQGFLLEAQEAQAALVAEKRELEERIRQLEAWDGEKKRYQLEPVGQNGFAYVLKPDAAGSEPPHQICAHCYEHGRKSLLMGFTYNVGRAQVLRCHQCQSEIVIHGIPPNEHPRPSPPAATWGRDPYS